MVVTVARSKLMYKGILVKFVIQRRFIGMDGFVVDVFIVLMWCLDFLDISVETVFVVSSILDYSGGTIGFHEAVRTFDATVTVAHFVLAFDVVRVQVFYGILEMIRRRSVVIVMFIAIVFGWIGEDQMPEQSGENNQL